MKTGLQLSIVGAVCALVVAGAHLLTRDAVARQDYEARLIALSDLVGPDEYDNNPWQDAIEFASSDLLGQRGTFSIARCFRDNLLVAALIPTRAPDGYAGAIDILVAVDGRGEIRGVRILRHTETPGIGDLIESQKSEWLTQFTGRSLTDPPPAEWRLRPNRVKDGAGFDAVSAATVTSRAALIAIRNALEFFAAERPRLMRPDS